MIILVIILLIILFFLIYHIRENFLYKKDTLNSPEIDELIEEYVNTDMTAQDFHYKYTELKNKIVTNKIRLNKLKRLNKIKND